MIETIIILGIMVVILGYTTINLLVKNEKAEDIIVSQQKYISLISEIIKTTKINSALKFNDVNFKFMFEI